MTAISRTILAVVAASMTVLPVAAQAGTRAGDNRATYSVSAPGKGRNTNGERLLGVSLVWSIYVVGGLARLGVLATESIKNGGKTPGAR